MKSPARPPRRGSRILAIDPGRDKCGVAVLDARDGILARGVIPTSVIGPLAQDWAAAHRPQVLVVGAGTALRQVRAALADLELPIAVVPETNTTLRARARYFEEHPPRGIMRLFPGLLTPPVPIDDYAAVLIGEDYLAARAQEE